MDNLIFDEGLRYIPVPPMSKAPVAKGWNRIENTISEESEAWQLEGKNAALALAYCDPPVVHWDCDDYPLRSAAWLAPGRSFRRYGNS